MSSFPASTWQLKAILKPSGDQAGWAAAAGDSIVSWILPEPSGFTTQISTLPALHSYASLVPSGAHAGACPDVTLVNADPSAWTIAIAPFCENAIRSANTHVTENVTSTVPPSGTVTVRLLSP